MKRFYFVLVLLFCLFIWGCNLSKTNNHVDSMEYVTVTFDTDGGSRVESQRVEKGSNVSKPANPIKEGYTFIGWFIGDDDWRFNVDVVSKDITLIAKWECCFNYKVNDNMIIITGLNNTSLTHIVIPNNIESKEVVSIDNGAFYGCTSLASITIPDSVTSIGDSAFSSCSSLASVTIPNSVTSIGNWAFSDCTSLTSITIPDSVTSIGDSAFSSCSSLASITVSENNLKYDSRKNCNAIIETSSNKLVVGCANTIIPDSVTSIGSSAFSGCTSLIRITIPESVTSIEFDAFSGCTSLTNIIIPNSVTIIGIYDAIPDTIEATSYELAFVTDIGKLKDKSFNQGTWEGLKRFATENNKSYKYYQPAGVYNATDDDRYNAMKQAIDNGAKVIVCAGFMQYGALERAAKEFTNVKFVFIDGWDLGLENVTAIVYKEEQAGYLAGYAAVMEGYTKLGFSGGGGGTNSASCRFGYGFIQGANDAAKAKGIDKVDMKYSWKYGESFSASPELQTMLGGWYTTGTQVVFTCGGSMCQSAFAAAKANNGKVIGVDVDQSAESSTVITSATKVLREGAMWALQKFYDGKWSEIANQEVRLGVKDDAVGLPTETWSLKNWSVSEYEKLLKDIVDGKVTIDSNPEGAETKTYSNVTVDYVK